MKLQERLEELIEEARADGRAVEHYQANGQRFAFLERADGWIQIINTTDPGNYRPEIEAADRAHAVSYCEMLEPLRVPVQEIAPRDKKGEPT